MRKKVLELREQWRLWDKRKYVIAFILPILILYVAYVIFGIYPFGDKSELVLDLNGQYVYYYEHFRDVFFNGASPFISWSRNLTGETMGLFAYYLASPFSVLFLVFPRSMIIEAVLVMQLLKVGTASVTFSWYLWHTSRCKDNRQIIFSVMYSLMAWSIVQLMNPMWLDGLIYLPLICYGIEQLVNNGKILQFIVPLALMFMSNFYIGWMLAIFSCTYFLVYYIFLAKNAKSGKNFVIRGVQFGLSGAISAMCAAWLLLPLYYSLSLGKFGFTEPEYDWFTQFDFGSVFVNLLPNVYDTCHPEGSVLLYCGVFTIILVPMFFFNKEIPLKRKFGYGILLLCVFVSMYISNLDIVWHGMQMPNWLPYRYSFIASFLLLLMGYDALKHIQRVSLTEVGLVIAAICAYVFAVDERHITIEYDSLIVEKTNVMFTIWFTVVFAIAYGVLLYLYKRNRGNKRRVFGKIACLLVCGEFLCTTVYTLQAVDRDVVYSDYDSYNQYISLGRDTVTKIYDYDDSPVYRIEKNFVRTVNDPMAFGYYGVSHSSSTLNEGVIEFLHNMGFSYGIHSTEYRGATYVTDALLGIKYVMELRDKVRDVSEIVGDLTETEETVAVFTENTTDIFADKNITENAETVENSGNYDVVFTNDGSSMHYDEHFVLKNENNLQEMYVYENPYALPIAYMADSGVSDLHFETWENPFENQNKLLSAVVGDSETEYFKSVNIKYTLPTNVKTLSDGETMLFQTIDVDEPATVEYLFDAPTEDMLYMYFPTDYSRECSIYVNGEYLADYYGYDTMTILALGRYDVGETVSVKVVLDETEQEVYIKDTLIYYLDEVQFANAVEMLKEQRMEVTRFNEDNLCGTVTAEKDGILFTTITYEPGWSVYVDGTKVEPIKCVDALLGIPMTVGKHTVEMRFFPKGLGFGIGISVVGLCVVVVIWCYERHRRLNAKEN